jgi:excisionase family DNA binding protein
VNDVKLLTVKEVAHALRVSHMTVYRLVKSGELEAIKVGRAFRIHEDSFEAYLAGNRTTGVGSPP